MRVARHALPQPGEGVMEGRSGLVAISLRRLLGIEARRHRQKQGGGSYDIRELPDVGPPRLFAPVESCRVRSNTTRFLRNG